MHTILILIASLLTVIPSTLGANPCRAKSVSPGKIVCECDSDYCDTVDSVQPESAGRYAVYSSNKAGLRFHKATGGFQPDTNDVPPIIASLVTITVNPNRKYQKVRGFGGALTDATGINIKKLPEAAQDKLLESYFSEHGIGYNVVRVPIAGTDFSKHGYSYLDNTTHTYNFTVYNYPLAAEDFLYKIPIVHKAQNLTKSPLYMFASAWIAPRAWKSNGQYSSLSFLRGEFKQQWADYQYRFLELYKQQGITFNGITTGNEPSTGLVPISKIPSVAWFISEQGKWIRDYFGPTIRKFGKIDIIGLDDQRFLIVEFEKLLADNVTKSFIQGVGGHWYWDYVTPAALYTDFHNKHPDIFILGTEACTGSNIWEKSVDLGNWERGETYSKDIILDLLNYVTGWTDWNMALDMTGGPSYISNNVDSPILVDAGKSKFYKQPMFYALGHFSKFLLRDSIRIEHTGGCLGCQIVVFQRPDNAIVVTVLNERLISMPIKIVDPNKGTIQLQITAKSINTIIYWRS